MSRRIEVELTSRGEGTWTWRAAGARQPKGTLDGSLLPAEASVGDVLRADVETGIDGTTVLAVLPPKEKRAEPELLELLPSRQREELVTTTLVSKGRPDRGERRDRPERGDRGDRGDRRDGTARPRSTESEARTRRAERPSRARAQPGDGDRRPHQDRPDGAPPARSPRRERPAPPPKPRAKRLRAGREHRKAALQALSPEQRVVAEQVLRGGVPAVRQAVDKQNEQARAEGHPEVKAEPLVALAEQLLPALRAAEWHDRAAAALADIDELDLRDLRSVVVAADTAVKDDEARELAAQLRAALTRRVDEEQSAWLTEIAATLAEDRVVRALRLSSRPPKAGSPFPPELASRLAAAASAGLTSDTVADRWATVLDALSFAPIRLVVTPSSIPDKPSEELVAAVRRVADRLPQIAARFGVEADAAPKRRRSARPRPAAPSRSGAEDGPRTRAGLPVPPPPPRGQVFGAVATIAPETRDEPTPPAEHADPEPDPPREEIASSDAERLIADADAPPA